MGIPRAHSTTHIGPTWRLAMEWKTLIEDFRAGLRREIGVVTCTSYTG